MIQGEKISVYNKGDQILKTGDPLSLRKNCYLFIINGERKVCW